MLKAAQAAGVEVALTIEGDKVTATPMGGAALRNPCDAADDVEAWIKKQAVHAR